jgi:RNA polymerase sigma-70 factor (ECF subfamily)
MPRTRSARHDSSVDNNVFGAAAASNPTSLELLRRARSGDTQALNRLFERYLPQLARWAHQRVPAWARNAEDTGDLVQETILHGFRHLQTFEPQRQGALLGYLRRALVNRIRDQFRRASRHPMAELQDRYFDSSASPLELTIDQDDRRRYDVAMNRLRKSDRSAIVGRIELGYSYEQLAVMLGKPTAEAARLAVRRALVRLGREMQRGEK